VKEVKFRIPEGLFEKIEELSREKGIEIELCLRFLVQKGLKLEMLEKEDDADFAFEAGLHEPDDLKMVEWANFKADRTIFWSSPEELPLFMVICSVLRSGRTEPLFALLKEYGSEKIEYYLEVLREEAQINPGTYRYVKKFIEYVKARLYDNNPTKETPKS